MAQAKDLDIKKIGGMQISPFINGEQVASVSDDIIEVLNPTTGKKIMDIPAGCDEDVNQAVSNARKAFDDGRWSEAPPSQRQAVLNKFADLIAKEATKMDVMDAVEMGKPVGLPMFNGIWAAGFMRYFAEAVNKIFGNVYISDVTTFVTQRRVPRGVVAAVVPWNFPTANGVLKLAPALAAGNCVILKPSEHSSQSALRLAHLAIEAGLPPGVFNVVPGKGDVVARALALHMDVDMIAFTGSTEVGKCIAQYAGSSNLKVAQVECGGKSPHIVFADGVDLDVVADNVVQWITVNQGQWCSAGSRLIVQQEISKLLTEKIAERMQGVVAGDPLDQNTKYGPIVSKQNLERVMSYIAAGKESGADLVMGGNRILENNGGYFIEPTLFSNVAPDAKIAQEEIFGPVLSVMSFKDLEEAKYLANSTIYGLGAYLWTTDLSVSMKLAKDIRAGGIFVNAAPITGEGAGYSASMEPYGQTGFGVEGGLTGMEAYLRRQLLWFNHG